LGVDPERLLEAVDESTCLVCISHVEFKTAFINDAKSLAARCRETGAVLLLDVFQSVGVLPLQLEAWGVDAATGGCLKWLCGGPGNAFLYVDPTIAAGLEPRITGWMAHAAPFAFEPPPVRRENGAARFQTGTPSISALYAALPGLEIVTSIGTEAIRAKSLRLTSTLLDGARRKGFRVASPSSPELRGGTVSLDIPHAEEVAVELARNDIIVDYRPDVGLRIAPHFYNSLEECEDCLQTVAAILEDESWRRHTTSAGVTPR